MREPNPDDVEYPVEDTVEDTVENTQGWHRSHADDHAGKFPFGHPDTAARRKPVVIGQRAGDGKNYRRGDGKNYRRGDGQPLTSAISGPAAGFEGQDHTLVSALGPAGRAQGLGPARGTAEQDGSGYRPRGGGPKHRGSQAAGGGPRLPEGRALLLGDPAFRPDHDEQVT